MTEPGNNPAVFAQRLSSTDDLVLDDFPTPPWATRAMLEILLRLYASPNSTVWEPSCNRGHMVAPLRETFGDERVFASDIKKYPELPDMLEFDFIKSFPHIPFEGVDAIDWCIFNPPFKLGLEFIERALMLSSVGVAVIVRTQFLEGGERYERLFKDNPPNAVLHYVERVLMVEGVCRNPNLQVWDEKRQKWKSPSTATMYSWLIWKKSARRREPPIWIPPSRKRLEKPGDYTKEVRKNGECY